MDARINVQVYHDSSCKVLVVTAKDLELVFSFHFGSVGLVIWRELDVVHIRLRPNFGSFQLKCHPTCVSSLVQFNNQITSDDVSKETISLCPSGINLVQLTRIFESVLLHGQECRRLGQNRLNPWT